MNRRKLEKEFRQMVKDYDGQEAHNNIAGSVCEHYAVEFAIQQVKNCSIPNISGSLPTDDDIEKVAKCYDNSMSSMAESKWMPEGFKEGARWMRENLIGQ